jgi:regulatory protein YycI of two-component signal transduction system YycFG
MLIYRLLLVNISPKNITLRIKSTKKKLNSQQKVVEVSFKGNNITMNFRLNTLANYMKKHGFIKSDSTLFTTEWFSATKFGFY